MDKAKNKENEPFETLTDHPFDTSPSDLSYTKNAIKWVEEELSKLCSKEIQQKVQSFLISVGIKAHLSVYGLDLQFIDLAKDLEQVAIKLHWQTKFPNQQAVNSCLIGDYLFLFEKRTLKEEPVNYAWAGPNTLILYVPRTSNSPHIPAKTKEN